jgi:hypothetical protein
MRNILGSWYEKGLMAWGEVGLSCLEVGFSVLEVDLYYAEERSVFSIIDKRNMFSKVSYSKASYIVKHIQIGLGLSCNKRIVQESWSYL